MNDHICGCADQKNHVNVSEPERFASAVVGGLLLGLGLRSRHALPRLLTFFLGGSLIYRGASGHCVVYRALEQQSKRQEMLAEKQIDEAIEDTFPASDPPAFSPSVAGRSIE